MASSYSFGNSVRRSGPVRHMKSLFRGGVNPASGALAAGTRVRIKHSPGNAVRKVNL